MQPVNLVLQLEAFGWSSSLLGAGPLPQACLKMSLLPSQCLRLRFQGMRRGFTSPVLIIQTSQLGCTHKEKVYPRRRLFFHVTTLQPPQGIMNVLKSPSVKKACAERLVALSWARLPSLFSPLQSPEGSMQWRGQGWKAGRGMLAAAYPCSGGAPTHRTEPAHSMYCRQTLLTLDGSAEGTGAR